MFLDDKLRDECQFSAERARRAPIWWPLLVALLLLANCYPPPRPSPLASPAETRPDGAIRLTTPPAGASDQNPAFSPAGSRLVFTRFDNGYNRGPAGLFLLDLNSLQTARLTPVEDQDDVNLPGAAWRGGEEDGRIVFASDRLEADDLWRIAPDGADLTRITTHDGPPRYIEPSWSPDGQWIIFESDADVPDDRQQGSIWKVRPDGTGLTQLTGGPGGGTDDRQPNWSPAGSRILFQRRSPGSDDWNIYTMAPDGGDLWQVTTAPSSDTDASWSPDGTCIVYSSDHGGLPVPNIFVIAANGGQPVRVTFSDTNEDGAPSWSPAPLEGGAWIAFESHEGQNEDTLSALWRISATSVLCDGANDLCRVCLPAVFKNATHAPANWWQPPVNASWQWQLTGLAIDSSFDVDMYDIDMFDNDASTVAALHAQGRKVICYISAGSWEDWRPDADQFPDSVLGNNYEGYQ